MASKSQPDPRESGRQGGLERAGRLTAEQRKEISRHAAQKRWGTSVLPASYAGDLVIAGMEPLACAVVIDAKGDAIRLINQSAMLTALGRSSRPKSGDAGTVLFAANLQPFISDELAEGLRLPFPYITPGGNRAVGLPARLLPDACEVYLAARVADPCPLRQTQMAAAAAAEILVRGLARVGIDALVDEATGYQEARAKDALARILEAYIDKDLQAWVRTFPDDFYRQLFRLRELEYPAGTVKRPRYFGMMTNDIVYRRIAPGVLEELKRVQIRDDHGRPKHKLFQRLTQNVGYPKLREHLGSVVTLMKLSRDWNDFRLKLDAIHPRFGDTMTLALEFDETEMPTGL
jgi:hypothetical protein